MAVDAGAPYLTRVQQALADDALRAALDRATDHLRGRRDQAMAEVDAARLREDARAVRQYTIEHLPDLLERLEGNLIANGCQIHWARDAAEALSVVLDIARSHQVAAVVKSKSMVTEEIGLNDALERSGVDVVETDLGEFIIQKMGSRPMHILAPSVHVPREDVARLFSRVIGQGITPDSEIAEMVAAAREYLREKFFQADIGISGANVVAAETGTLFIIENEGNVRLATSAPPVHIALVGMEKLVPRINDAYKVSEVTWRYANYTVPSYVSLVSGPSKTGDIEKVTTYGAHGPREFHVIFLDGGRTELAKHPILQQALYCLRCGGCLYECPVFAITAGHFGDKYFTGIGAVWAAMISKNMEKAASIAYTCLTCGRCKQRCPVKIDVPEMVIELRRLMTESDRP